MIKSRVNPGTLIDRNEGTEGELIETKIERVVHNNEPIKDGAPLIYTERSEGVRKGTDIRTDRFDEAIVAMDKVAKSYKARRENKADMKVSKGGGDDAGDVGGTESIPDGTGD